MNDRWGGGLRLHAHRELDRGRRLQPQDAACDMTQSGCRSLLNPQFIASLNSLQSSSPRPPNPNYGEASDPSSKASTAESENKANSSHEPTGRQAVIAKGQCGCFEANEPCKMDQEILSRIITGKQQVLRCDVHRLLTVEFSRLIRLASTPR